MYDSKMAARVWERVQSAAPSPDLGTTLQEALVLTEVYGQLAAKDPQRRTTLLALRREQLELIQELNGLLYLEQGKRLPLKSPTPTPGLNLSQCCQRVLDWAALCTPHRQHPRYGPFFSYWEATAQRHCRTLLRLLGKA